MTIDRALLTRCDDALRAAVAAKLTAFPRRGAAVPAPEANAPTVAAVALVLLDEGPGAAVEGLPAPQGHGPAAALLLTRRARHLRRHAGQWALPGGRLEPGETVEAAALRELAEETGLELDVHAVLGRLDDFVTRSGFRMVPVVVWAGAVGALRPDPQEVASVHRIPCTEFLRRDAPRLEPAGEGAGTAPVLRMPVGRTAIAAPTAALLYQFREVVLLGRETRVAHFEQPRFAWS